MGTAVQMGLPVELRSYATGTSAMDNDLTLHTVSWWVDPSVFWYSSALVWT